MPGGKAKGSSFERVVSRKLSLYWSHGENETVFWRNTGIMAGGGRKQIKEYGDLHSQFPEGELFSDTVNVECKFYKDIDLLELVDKPDKKGCLLRSFWAQCWSDSTVSKRLPLLICKRNWGEEFAVSPLMRLSQDEGRLIVMPLEFGVGVYLGLLKGLLDTPPEEVVPVLEKFRRDNPR